MQPAFYSGAAALDTQMQIQETVAFNVANSNTPGFKRRITGVSNNSESFQAILDKAKTKFHLPKTNTAIDFSQGDLHATGNPFDVGLEGKGFFKVRVNGETRYTRNGSFTVNANGDLVTHAGHPVILKDSGGPLSPTEGDPAIAKDGSITQGINRLGQFDIARFNADRNDEAKLIPEGDGLFRAPEGVSEEASDAMVQQGSLESSNVNPIEEFIGMITTGRNFEAAQRLMRSVDDSVRKNLER